MPPYNDVALYRDVADAVSQGKGYYAAATQLHRQHGFPTSPFVTVRLPTLAYAAAALGWTALQLTLVALLLGGAVAWHIALRSRASRETRATVVFFLLLGGFAVSMPLAVPHHDLWAGVLLAVAIPLRTNRTWPAALILAAAAIAVRELAITFVLLSFALALFERSWRQSAAWGVLILLFAFGMSWHAYAVQVHALAADLQSPGWNAMRGIQGATSDIIGVSILKLLPAKVAGPVVVLALFGWLGAPRRIGQLAFLWLAGFGLAIALFARDNNTYWAAELMPTWLIGLAFLPTALTDLKFALTGRQHVTNEPEYSPT